MPLVIKFCVLLLSVSLLGCSGGDPVGSVVGHVASGGEAVGDCKVSLYSASTNLSIASLVDLQGDFSLNEIPVGDYQVAVLQKTNTGPENAPFDTRIPAKYRDPQTSELSVTINEGENDKLMIEIVK